MGAAKEAQIEAEQNELLDEIYPEGSVGENDLACWDSASMAETMSQIRRLLFAIKDQCDGPMDEHNQGSNLDGHSIHMLDKAHEALGFVKQDFLERAEMKARFQEYCD